MNKVFVVLLVIAGAAVPARAQHLPPFGGPYPPPFVATLNNNTPLVFGMNQEEAAHVAAGGHARRLQLPLGQRLVGNQGPEIGGGSSLQLYFSKRCAERCMRTATVRPAVRSIVCRA